VGVAAVVGLAGLVLLYDALTRPARFPLRGKVVLVTGGSSGIGKAVAAAALARGASVALLARRPALLEAAAAELRAGAPPPPGGGGAPAAGRVTTHAADVTDDAAVHAAVAAAAAAHGGVLHALVTSAGTSEPREFLDVPAAEFAAVLAVNVAGTRSAVHAAVPFMTAPAGGRVVFVSSQGGQVGLYGYTSYAASKFALAGLAQALAMELAPRRVLVSLAIPPDTDTPLLASENLQKPAVTRLLSEATATVAPAVVAAGVVAGIESWAPTIPVGFDGWMLSTLTAGMGPAGSLGGALVQVLTMGLWRAVGLLYVQSFYATVAAEARKAAAAARAAPTAPAPAPAAAAGPAK